MKKISFVWTMVLGSLLMVGCAQPPASEPPLDDPAAATGGMDAADEGAMMDDDTAVEGE